MSQVSLTLHQYFLEPSISMCTLFLHPKEILRYYIFSFLFFLFVLFVGFSNSRSLIIFILHSYNRLLIHSWLASVISLLCPPCPQTISTAEEEKHCIHLCFFRAQNIIDAQWATMELTCTWSCHLDFKLYFERSWERLEVFDGEGSGWHALT